MNDVTDLETRIRTHLAAQHAAADPAGAGEDAVITRGSRLRTRRRWVTVGGSVAAVLVGVVGALAIAAAFRSGAEDVTATELGGDVAPEAFRWFAVEGSVGHSRRTLATGDGTFYALSTVPGARGAGPDSAEPAIYRSSDGEVWDLAVPDADIFASDLAARDGVVYVVGTAPAHLVGEGEVLATVSSTEDMGRSWSVTELPTRARPPAGLDVNWVGATTHIAAGDAGIVAAVQTSYDVDVRMLVPAGAIGPGQDVMVTDTGVDIVDWMVFEEAAAACPFEGPDGPTDAADLSDECRAILLGDREFAVVERFTWEELGLDASSAPAFSELFFSADGERFEPVPSPFQPGHGLMGIHSTGEGFMAFEAGGRVWQSGDGRTWAPLTGIPPMDWVTAVGALHDERVIVGSARGRPVVAWEVEGAWVEADPLSALAEVASGERWLAAASVGPLGLVAALETWDEATQTQTITLFHAIEPESWHTIPLEGLLPTGQAGVGWVMVGTEEILVQISRHDTPTPVHLQLIATPSS